jgi:hypothetical protein
MLSCLAAEVHKDAGCGLQKRLIHGEGEGAMGGRAAEGEGWGGGGRLGGERRRRGGGSHGVGGSGDGQRNRHALMMFG